MVTGVGGRAWLSDTAAEAMILLLGVSSLLAEVIVASAAFRFLVVGGIVAVLKEKVWDGQVGKEGSSEDEDEGADFRGGVGVCSRVTKAT